MPRTHPKRKDQNIQSVLFSKDKFKMTQMLDFLRDNDLEYNGFDIKDNYVRFRQFDPESHKSGKYITKTSAKNKDVKYIIAV